MLVCLLNDLYFGSVSNPPTKIRTSLSTSVSGLNFSYDFGSPVVPTQCQFYVSFSGTPYNSVVDFQGSSDNSTFTSFFQGNVNSSANPASPQCGLHEFSNLARL